MKVSSHNTLITAMALCSNLIPMTLNLQVIYLIWEQKIPYFAIHMCLTMYFSCRTIVKQYLQMDVKIIAYNHRTYIAGANV